MFRLDTRWKRSVNFIDGTCRALTYTCARIQASLTSLSRALGSCTLTRVCVRISARTALIAEGDRKASTIRSARFSRAFLRSSRNRWDESRPSREEESEEKGEIESNTLRLNTDEPMGDSTNAVNHRGCSKSRLFPRSRDFVVSLCDAFRVVTLLRIRWIHKGFRNIFGEFSKRAKDNFANDSCMNLSIGRYS